MVIEKSESELSAVSSLWSPDSILLPFKSTKVLVIGDRSCLKISNWLLGMFIGRLNSDLLNVYAMYFGYLMFQYTDDINQQNARKINCITSF